MELQGKAKDPETKWVKVGEAMPVVKSEPSAFI